MAHCPEPKRKQLIAEREAADRESSAMANWIFKLGKASRENAKKRVEKV